MGPDYSALYAFFLLNQLMVKIPFVGKRDNVYEAKVSQLDLSTGSNIHFLIILGFQLTL